MQIVKKSTLPSVKLNGEVAAHIFDGGAYGDLDSSAFIVDVAPGTGPRRHKHPYGEIFIIIEGTVRLEADGEVVEATAEDICVVPSGVPHAFSNVGTGRAKMVNIHATSNVVTEFVDDPAGDSGVSYEYNHAG